MGRSKGLREDMGRLVHGAYRPIDDRASTCEGEFRLGMLLEERRDVAGAEQAYRSADLLGHPAAACNLGILLERRHELRGAERAYRRADRRGDADGAFNLGSLLEERGELRDAEAAYARADRRGHAAAACNLGALLAERGQETLAAAAFQRALTRGDPDAAENLAALTGSVTGADGAAADAEPRSRRTAPPRLALAIGVPSTMLAAAVCALVMLGSAGSHAQPPAQGVHAVAGTTGAAEMSRSHPGFEPVVKIALSRSPRTDKAHSKRRHPPGAKRAERARAKHAPSHRRSTATHAQATQPAAPPPPASVEVVAAAPPATAPTPPPATTVTAPTPAQPPSAGSSPTASGSRPDTSSGTASGGG
ncbi:MAG: hypothetical protein ACRDMJ_17035 [Solirubrobacteraceae bacterium]